MGSGLGFKVEFTRVGFQNGGQGWVSGWGVRVRFRDEARGRVFRDGVGIGIRGRVHGWGRVSK